MLFSQVLMNQQLISCLFTKYATALGAINIILLLIGMVMRVYGFENIKDEAVKIGLNVVACCIIYPLYIYIN